VSETIGTLGGGASFCDLEDVMTHDLVPPGLSGRRRMFAAALVLAGLTAAGTFAGPIKIKRLKAEVTPGQEMWAVEARYEVRIKNACGPFQLVLFATDRNRTIVDCDGRPIEVVIPLDQPTSIHKEEMRFAGRACLRVFRAPNWDCKHLRLHAVVTCVDDWRPLAEKSTKLKVKD
jgi:hypothetical protein